MQKQVTTTYNLAFYTLSLQGSAESTGRYKQVCSHQNETQAEKDAAITFSHLGQMGYSALKSLPTEAAQPDSCLGTDRGQQETKTSSEPGPESRWLGCWS